MPLRRRARKLQKRGGNIVVAALLVGERSRVVVRPRADIGWNIRRHVVEADFQQNAVLQTLEGRIMGRLGLIAPGFHVVALPAARPECLYLPRTGR